MKSYWDLTEKERAELTDLSAYEKIELMEQGIIVPAEPEYEKVLEVDVPTHKVYRLTYNSRYNSLPIHFNDLIQAEEVAAALRGGMTLESDYNTGKSFVRTVEEISITTQDVCEECDINRSRSALAEAKAAKNRNKNLRAEYRKACEKQSETLSEMRDDWYKCQGTLRRMQKIRAVWEDYLETCGGDRDVALKFLRKAYDLEEIEQMRGWLDVNVPLVKEAVDEDQG